MNTPKRGFTLIELLVVIAIVAVLIALSFPVFASVREKGRRATCQSNLHQMGLATQQYLQENDGQYGVFMELAITPYVKDNRVMVCPDGPDNSSLSGGMNYDGDTPRLTIQQTADGRFRTSDLRGISEAQITQPTTLWLFKDQWCCHVPYREIPGTCGHDVYGATFHSGGADYSFVDGHVKWLTPEQFAVTACTNGPTPGWVGE